jgi:hypothetical protein
MVYYGMKYDIVPEKQLTIRGSNGKPTKINYGWHNFKANWRLFWRNGFFWKSRMHKKIKKCREESGEIDDN